jgi:uncharacterized UPF0146 family protein
MTKTSISREMLQEIRELLPWGAQTEIAKRLAERGRRLTVQDVNKVLHGRGLRFGKPDVREVILEATEIITAVQAENERINKAVDEVLSTAESM